jgi:single-stranded-DNA-specific exonuclease
MIAPRTAPQWVPHPRADHDCARRLAGELDAPLAAATVLVHRGVRTVSQAERFLRPTLADLHDPHQLLGLDQAVERIERAVRGGERILIFGDYDVDGITATFLLHSVLRDLGARASCRLPHRTRDGYGLTPAAVEQAAAQQVGLIVTVDCGITAHDAVLRAGALGIDVVVTDHHEPGGSLPAAAAVVNPLREGCSYPFKSLAGVGVAFKLAEALLRERGGRERASEFLDVVAIGTIADVVPLVGENRVLARAGLERLGRTNRPGLRALRSVAGIEGGEVSSGQVAFVLAPRINAAGRMGNAEQSLRLLMAREEGEARACAESLEEDNRRRREADEEVLAQAVLRVETELKWPECASILLWSERWHPGVIGIVASRLVERFQRPALLVALDGGRGRGSGRSLPGVDLTRLLGRCDDLLEGYGGHSLAAGLTVRRERLPELQARFEALVREQVPAEAFVRRLVLDGELAFSACDLPLVGWLDRLSPHGLGNPEPLYSASGVRVESSSAVGGGRHLRLRLRDGTSTAEAIGFGLGDRLESVRQAAWCDVAFVPTRNEWAGETKVQLKVKDVRPQ